MTAMRAIGASTSTTALAAAGYHSIGAHISTRFVRAVSFSEAIELWSRTGWLLLQDSPRTRSCCHERRGKRTSRSPQAATRDVERLLTLTIRGAGNFYRQLLALLLLVAGKH